MDNQTHTVSMLWLIRKRQRQRRRRKLPQHTHWNTMVLGVWLRLCLSSGLIGETHLLFGTAFVPTTTVAPTITTTRITRIRNKSDHLSSFYYRPDPLSLARHGDNDNLTSHNNDDDDDDDKNHRISQQASQTLTPDSRPRRRRHHHSFVDAVTLKESVDIVNVVESFGLSQFTRPHPHSAMALCPFHKDTHPSLRIDGKKQLYKCFACGAGGDVYQFVRQYQEKETGTEWSFPQAVTYVHEHWGGGGGGGTTTSNTLPTKTLSLEDQAKKDRLYVANAAAAAFYANQLTMPSAGAARSYLVQRGLSVTAARTFAMGYATDVYFGGSTTTASWGDGSLVQHLQGLNFTAQEIVDAGLAVLTKRSASQQTKTGTNTSTTTEETLDYSSIMDRFRNRLVVPILDASGKHVLGFGGRSLPNVEPPFASVQQPQKDTNFYNPKYLNSPESLVFSKKDILFGAHLLQQQTKEPALTGAESSRRRSDVVIVEGYLDVIALRTAGFHGSVASMGTALSKQQLLLGCKLASQVGGRLVLCLDNDNAGMAAVERVCSNGMLGQVALSQKVDILVATLPDEIKDPAEFIEQTQRNGNEKDIAESFQTQIVDTALDWVKWYTNRIIAGYQSETPRGQVGSFQDVFQRVANFLGTSLDTADRTKAAYEVSGYFAGILANETNASSISDAVQSQLECDLVDLASRVAKSKEGIERRAESVIDGSQSSPNVRSVVAAWSRGHGPSGSEDQGLSRKERRSRRTAPLSGNPPDVTTEKPVETRVRKGKRQKHRLTRPVAKPLTPHFSGFQFANKRDAEWLGLDGGKNGNDALVLGDPNQTHERQGRYNARRKQIVYFNSNDYHGHRFLTDEAREAGYDGSFSAPDPSVVENGIASLVKRDYGSLKRNSEDTLLKSLVFHRSGRTTMRNILNAQSAVGSTVPMDWSCPVKEWLFQRLVTEGDSMPLSADDPDALRSFLKSLEDCPSDAFSNVNNGVPTDGGEDEIGAFGKSPGILDGYFDAEEDDTAISELASCDATFQNLYTTMVLASSVERANRFQYELEQLQPTSDDWDSSLAEVAKVAGNNTQLWDELRETMRTIQSLSESSRLLTSKLIETSHRANRHIEGRISSELQRDLADQMDEFFTNFKASGIGKSPAGGNRANDNKSIFRELRQLSDSQYESDRDRAPYNDNKNMEPLDCVMSIPDEQLPIDVISQKDEGNDHEQPSNRQVERSFPPNTGHEDAESFDGDLYDLDSKDEESPRSVTSRHEEQIPFNSISGSDDGDEYEKPCNRQVERSFPPNTGHEDTESFGSALYDIDNDVPFDLITAYDNDDEQRHRDRNSTAPASVNMSA